MLAHHEAIVLLQAGGYVSLSGFAAMIAARWYALTRRTRRATGDASSTTAPRGVTPRGATPTPGES